ncbi:MAG: hypothetical protein M1825_004342 [Sarcosagium campestre]|nr:MAG: hypothetical protein M1825_004342 [Sarcosagium campestre]
MADRFPSIEELSGGQTEAKNESNLSLGEDSSKQDFLTREKAALGDDANQFAGSSDSFKPSATVEDGDDDLLGGNGDLIGGNGTGGGEVSEFESSFPALDAGNERVAPGGTVTGTSPFPTSQPYSSYSAPQDEEEPEVIKAWRERRDIELQSREEDLARSREETIKAARQAVDDFYENYNTKKDKTIAATRKEAEDFLAGREDTSAGGTSWERIAKLVDLSGKGVRGGGAGTGKERFRELLLNLRKDEKAPGATGY